jgi:thiamine pyrophosphate-dependent acetolactate synthase large subunit-like protein
MQPCTVRALGDTVLGMPALTAMCRERIARDESLAARIAARRAAVGRRHDEVWAKWQQDARTDWDASPITLPRLASEVWEVVKDEDFVLSAGTLKNWVRKMWNFDRPYQHPGVDLGTATQIGISLGVALAHKGSGRIVVDLQPDGDLMFDVGALWVASRYELPLLVVMYNNRAYHNDWAHQERLARQRGTPLERASIGMAIDTPAPDFAAIARGFGWWADGPVVDPAAVQPAVRAAADHVLATGGPALVDVVCQPG